ncbi:patatin-like phospholipase family protein [Leptospira sp. 201903071]|uniref:patatin-like phospholipase family protein n=1 Tax=Leptospira ainazelensis TaxID=2810034 RepID=UPI001966BD5B|nr:patatin-like phospholipase family protein [Leptospira ainazelensis]MBM9498702.1 patatin-like phospholipase family protein [Leptospira ainazelensis]
MALSGGGVRANAFNLGLMSALNAVTRKNKQIKMETNSISYLQRIDYISSVSGGSWSSAAYIAYPNEDSKLFDCLDSFALFGNEGGSQQDPCEEIQRRLRLTQYTAYSGGRWKEDILKYSMPEFTDFTINKLYDRNGFAEKRPYPIFNTTHSVPFFEENYNKAKHYPFEFTPFGFGTDMDCGNTNDDCKKWGIRTNQDKKGIFTNSYLTFQKKNIFGIKSDIQFSDILRASSAFLNLTLGITIHSNVQKDERVRDEYTLSDGGKSDNLGLFSLVVRNVPTIIVTDIGNYSYENFNMYEDIRTTLKIIETRLGVTIDIEKVNYQNVPVIQFEYKLLDRKNGAVGKIFYVKPMVTEKFYTLISKCKKSGKSVDPDLLKLFKNSRKYFPNDVTVDLEYEEERVRLYYLLGRIIGTPLYDIMNLKSSDWKNEALCK